MKYLRVTTTSIGEPGRWRWVLQAEFNTRHGFVPAFDPDPGDWLDCAVVAIDEKGLAGALRWNEKSGSLHAGGTWVRRDLRRSGLGQMLWKRALRGMRQAEVTTISRGGRRLVKRLRENFPKVSWITDYA